MAQEPHVTAGEFERTTDRMFAQLDRIEDAQKATNGRVTALEVEQKITKRVAAYISAGIGTAFAIAGLVISYFK